MTTSRYEYPFDPEKPNNTAASVFRLARDGGTRILDLGAGPGIVAGALASTADKDVTCVDAEDHHLEAATERGVQRVVRGDLTSTDWLGALAGEQFDTIILADVLEHLVDPGQLLARIRDRELLAEGGSLVVSFPNASHIAILALLATGDFPYRPAGLLDATHLRFFTLTSMRRLLEEVGFGCVRVLRTTRRLDQTEFADVADRLSPETVAHLERQHEESDAYQYVLRAQSLPTADLAALREETAELRRRNHKLDVRRRRAVADRNAAREEADEARARADELRQQLAAVYASATWRAGRLVVALPAAAKRRRRP